MLVVYKRNWDGLRGSHEECDRGTFQNEKGTGGKKKGKMKQSASGERLNEERG